MANWQERINEEINRRATQSRMLVQGSIKSFEIIEAERRKKEAEEAMQKLKPEELNALKLLDRIGVRSMLEGIRDEVWGGHGVIETQEFTGENSIYRRIHLVFKYKYPEPNWKYAYDKKFGFYEETYKTGSTGGGAGENGGEAQDNYSTVRKFGHYQAQSGYGVIERCAFHETGEWLEVGIVRDYSGFFLELPHYNKFKLSPQSLDETGAKKTIEKSFLNDCIERQKNKYLPADLLERVEHNKAIIQKAIDEKKRFRFEESGEKGIESQLGLVKAYR